jgi:hypothetical protein
MSDDVTCKKCGRSTASNIEGQVWCYYRGDTQLERSGGTCWRPADRFTCDTVQAWAMLREVLERDKSVGGSDHGGDEEYVGAWTDLVERVRTLMYGVDS